jgi:hypothetical protein
MRTVIMTSPALTTTLAACAPMRGLGAEAMRLMSALAPAPYERRIVRGVDPLCGRLDCVDRPSRR